MASAVLSSTNIVVDVPPAVSLHHGTLLEKVRKLLSVRGNLCEFSLFLPNEHTSLLAAVNGIFIPEVKRAIAEQRMPVLPCIDDILLYPEVYPEEVSMLEAATFSDKEHDPLPGFKSCAISYSAKTGKLTHFSIVTDDGTSLLYIGDRLVV